MLEYKEYIYSVYRNRSFSRAAEELHISQPWLSAAIKKAEQELQLKLFDRTTNPVSLTEAGRFYIEQIEQIMAIEERMRQRFARMRAASGETLRVGSSMFFCTYVLPSILRDFRSQNPQAAITLVEGSPDDLMQRLLKGELDVVLDAEEADIRILCLCLTMPNQYMLSPCMLTERKSIERNAQMPVRFTWTASHVDRLSHSQSIIWMTRPTKTLSSRLQSSTIILRNDEIKTYIISNMYDSDFVAVSSISYRYP